MLYVFGANHPATGALQQFRRGLEGFWRRDPQFETQPGGGKNPRVHHVARAVPDERYDFALNRPALFLKREDIRQDLAWMLLISERVDRRYGGITGKILDVLLCVSPEHRSVDDSPQHARRVFDRFAAAQLNFCRRQKCYLAAQLADTHIKRDPRPRRGLRKEHRPDLPGQRTAGVSPSLLLEPDSVSQNFLHLSPRQFLNAQQMLHRPISLP